MTGPQLRAWRHSEGLTLREVVDILGDPTQPTLSRWEASESEIPQWATDTLLNRTKITLPLSELHQLLDVARNENVDLPSLLALAIQEYLARRRKDKPDGSYAKAAALGTAAMTLNETPPDLTDADVDAVVANTLAGQAGQPTDPDFVPVPLDADTTPEQAAAIRALFQAPGAPPSAPAPRKRARKPAAS